MNLENVIAKRHNKTVYKYEDMAVKVFNEEFSKTDVLNEALNQAKVEETGLNIPKIREVTKIDGKWAIFADFIEGQTFAEIIAGDKENTESNIKKFVDIQLEIHSKKSPLLNKLKDKMKRKINETKLDATTKYDLQTRLEGMPKHTKVCHGDFNPSNIIITNEGTPYIIDWSHATQGNASADVARTYLLFMLKGEEDNANLYLKEFCLKSDTAKQYVQQWLPIVAASQTVKGNAEEKEFLMRWIDVVDYE